MPGTILADDAESMYADRLRQHAQSVWDTIANAPQQVAQAVQPAFQAASSASQNIQPILPSIPQGPDPTAIASAQQSLLQHAQDAWNSVQQPAQAVQPTAQAVDPTAAASASQRLLQHANDTWQSVGQGLTQATQPTPTPTVASQPTVASPVAQDQTQAPTQPATPTGPEPDRAMSYQDYAKAAARKAGIDPNVFMAQIQQESGFNPSARSPAGAIGIAQFMPGTAAGVNLDPTDPYASLDAAAAEDAKRLQQYNGDWGKTLASYNAGAGAVAQYGGIPPYKETQSYVSTIMGNAQKAADAAGTTISGAVQAGQQAVGNAVSTGQQIAGQAVDATKQAVGDAAQSVLPAVSQFGDKQLSSSEAYAACGPAAAVRFAQMYGRNPTLREAVDLAKGVGWSADTGMAGLQSESKLFDEMGIPHRVVGADWQGLAKEASSGNPVTISTPGHYFTADAYNAQTGAFHVGSSGTDLRRGSEWMTPQQMETVMGPLQGGLAADNPNNPGASPLSQKASGPTTATTTATTPGPVAAVQQGWQAVGGGLQSIDSAVQDAAQGVQQLNQQTPGTAAVQAVQAAAPSVGAAAQDIAQRAGEAVQQAPLPFGAGKVGDVTGAVQDVARQVQVPDESNPLATRAAGGTLSTVGTIAKEATDALDKVNIASTAAREATGGDQYGKMYAQAGGPALEDEYRQLLNQRLAGDDSVNPRMTQIVDQLQAINTTIRDGKPLSEVNQTLSAQNPATTPLVTAANLGAAALAAPLAAGDAPLAARALAELLQPGTNPLELAKALTIVNDAKGSVPEVANAVDKAWQAYGGRITDTATQRAQQIASMDDTGRNQLVQAIANALPVQQVTGAASKVASALSDLMKPDLAAPQLEQAIKTVNETTASVPEIIDQVRKMPGTAELAPVRQQVPQSSTDLLQAMLDAARAKGVDPDKLAALEQQITAMDPAAATRRGLGDLLTGESGAVALTRGTLRAGATLGGAVAGGIAGNATTPEDAMTLPMPLGNVPVERGARILAGAGLGAGLGSAVGFQGSLDKTILESLRSAGLHTGPPRPAAPYRGIIPEAVDQTKQMLLTSPTTHIGNVIGNTIELARQPAALAMGGRGDDALASVTSVVKAIPEAARNAISALGGLEPANLSQGAANIPLRQPIYRALSAADAFTRTLGEYQGMSAKANQLLRDAGMAPGDPGAAAYLATRASDLFQAGTRSGAQSVFGQAGSTATATSGLENLFRVYNTFKEGLLNSPDQKSKAMGALLDFEIPFSGVPVRLVKLVGARTPGGTQARGAVRFGQALAKGDGAAAQQAAGETALESSIQFLIAKNIADGNIRGADDPDHPNGVHLPGLGWINMSELGGYALPMQIMASFADGFQKGGTNITDDPKANPWVQRYGPSASAALNASMKPLVQAVPGMNVIRFLSTALNGDVTGAGIKLAQDAVNRMTVPGAARFVENLTDPVARDVAKKGVQAIYEPAFASLPGVAQLLPPKIDPTTGEPLERRVGGLGTLVGQQRDIASPLTIEADRLNRKLGFTAVTAPKTYADSVTIQGAKVNLSPDEQRAVTQLTGTTLDKLSQRMDTPEYQNAPDSRKALLLKAWVNAADNSRTAAVAKVLGQPELRSRIVGGKNIAGQLVNQAQAPTPDEFFSGFDPTSGENILEQRRRRLAGAA